MHKMFFKMFDNHNLGFFRLFPDLLHETMSLIESTSFLEFFHGFPDVMASLHISFKVPLDIVGHTLCKFCHRTSADAIHVYESLVIETIDE